MTESIIMSSQALEDSLDCISWYRDCLEDVAQARRVTGYAEAKAGYESAMREIQEAMGYVEAKPSV